MEELVTKQTEPSRGLQVDKSDKKPDVTRPVWLAREAMQAIKARAPKSGQISIQKTITNRFFFKRREEKIA